MSNNNTQELNGASVRYTALLVAAKTVLGKHVPDFAKGVSSDTPNLEKIEARAEIDLRNLLNTVSGRDKKKLYAEIQTLKTI